MQAKENAYIIDLNNVCSAGQSFDFKLDDAFFEHLEQDEILAGQVVATVRMNGREKHYEASISFSGMVSVTCDRCLEPMQVEVNDSAELMVVQGSGEEDENTAVVGEDGLWDLSWVLYELIETSLPIVHCHKAGECNPQMEELLHAHLCTEAGEDE